MSLYLDMLLGECYRHELLGGGNLPLAKSTLKDKLAVGSALEKEARNRLANLEKVKDRCFVSKKSLEYLNDALI